MELVIAGFIGLWLSAFALWGYKQLKKDYSEAQDSLSNDRGEDK